MTELLLQLDKNILALVQVYAETNNLTQEEAINKLLTDQLNLWIDTLNEK